MDGQVMAMTSLERDVLGGAVVPPLRLWNGAVHPQPRHVVRASTTDDVQRAVLHVREQAHELSVLGGGHDWAGRGARDGSVVLDLGDLRGVEVAGTTARVGGGATVADVLDAARPYGLAAVGGTVGSVGYAGLLLGGGLGPLAGAAGLAADSLMSAQVVLADGRLVTADAEHEPELFWALRGGGGNFGVVTEMTVALHPYADALAGLVAFGWHEAREVLEGWHDAATPDDLFDLMFGVQSGPDGPVLFTTPTGFGDPGRAAAHVERVRGLGAPIVDQVARVALADAVHALDETYPAGAGYHLSTRTLPPLTDGALDAFITAAEAMPPACALLAHHQHGQALAPAAPDTAYVYRDEHLVLEILGVWHEGDGSAERSWVASTERLLEPYALPGGWTNLMRPGDQRAQDAFGAATGRVLRAKRRYDPDNVFSATTLPDQAEGSGGTPSTSPAP